MLTYFLALDQSTSASKALLFDSSGALLHKTSRPHRQIYPRPGWVEHDADEIYENTLAAIRDLAAHAGEPGKLFSALSLTNQRETFVIFEREGGKPLHNAVVWQCRRGEAVCERLHIQGHGALVQERTGLKIDTYFPAPKLAHLLDEYPALHRKLENGRALVGTMDAYLIYRLTGGHVFATDATNASRTLLYDVRKGSWDEDLCRLFGVPQQALPEVRDCDSLFGETHLEGLLDKPIPICGVMGDSQAALFGQRCFEAGGAKVTFGSGSSLLLNLGGDFRLSDGGLVTALAWSLGGTPTYAFEGITNFTGATITWLAERLELLASPEESEALALSVDDSGGVYLVPAFVGLSAPYWRPEARAAILGLTPYSTRAHVARAALESIAYIVKDVLDLMSRDGGVALKQVRADGGAVRNRFLMQFVADVTRLQVRASSLPELSALGAVFAGMLGMRLVHSLPELAKLPLESQDYDPVMSAGRAAELCAGWQNAVRQVLS